MFQNYRQSFFHHRGSFRLNWEKFELTVHLRNHLNRMKHVARSFIGFWHSSSTIRKHASVQGRLLNLQEQFHLHADFLQRHAVNSMMFFGACLSSSTQAQGCLLPSSNHVHQVTGDSALPQEPCSKYAFGSLPFWCDETGFRTLEEARHFSCSFGRKANTAPHLLWLIDPTIVQGADESFAWDRRLVTYSGTCAKVGKLLLELVIFEQNLQDSRLSNSLQGTGRTITS